MRPHIFSNSERTFQRFADADYYLFSAPMWNHGIPYILKQFIDVVSQPGMVFPFDPEHGYTGLLAGKRAVVIYTSAVYGAGQPPAFGTDFQAPYLDDWLAWAGITSAATIQFRPNLVTADADAGRQEAAAAARSGQETLTSSRRHGPGHPGPTVSPGPAPSGRPRRPGLVAGLPAGGG